MAMAVSLSKISATSSDGLNSIAVGVGVEWQHAHLPSNRSAVSRTTNANTVVCNEAHYRRERGQTPYETYKLRTMRNGWQSSLLFLLSLLALVLSRLSAR